VVGNIYAMQGRLTEARSAFDQAIESDADFWAAYRDRGQVWHLLRDFDQAKRDYDEAIRINPYSPHAFNGRALVYHNLDQLDLALADLDRAVTSDPTFFEAYQNRARLRREQGRFDEALQDHERAIELRPGAAAYVARSVTYRMMGEPDKALADAEKAIEIEPNLTCLLYLLVWEIRSLRGRIGDVEVAAAALSQAQNHTQGEHEKRIMAAIGAPDSAVAPAEDNLSSQCEYAYYVGAAELVNQRPEEAVRWFRRCVKTHFVDLPEYHLAVWHLKRLHP